jgi:hypothetical protein
MLALAAAPGAGQSVAEKKATAYAAAVHQLNASRDSRQELKAATLFKDAYLSAVGEDRRGRSVDMLRVWQLVQVRLGPSMEQSLSMDSFHYSTAVLRSGDWHQLHNLLPVLTKRSSSVESPAPASYRGCEAAHERY